MKKLILILFLITNLVKAQDGKLFIYFNQYRNMNGKESIEWSTKLSKISKSQTTEMYEADSVFHSGTNVYECVLKGISLTPTRDDKIRFSAFLHKNFGIKYLDPADTENTHAVEEYLPLYTIYMWSKDPAHNAIMLADNVKEGSINMFVKSIKFKSNKVFINGKVSEFKNIISHYDCVWYATLNLK